MAIHYRDSRKQQSSGSPAGHLLAGIIALVCLLWFAPHTTDKLQSAVTSALRLPIY
jgi:hypothetical protein